MYLKYWKRVFDFTLAALGLIVFLIPIIVIALIILGTAGKPIFFIQTRIGRHAQPFRVIKFRTMDANRSNSSTVTVAGDCRITPIGKFLRRWKLDELPQLWNVLLGDMSFVGPRPDVPGYADRLQGQDRLVLQLRPGITGPATIAYRCEEEILAQVSNPIDFNDHFIYPDKVRINLKYTEEASLIKDFNYIWQTVSAPSFQKYPPQIAHFISVQSETSVPQTTSTILPR
jgi:lipopolysaccharide/colanic/teichoic acid biosynthesis glycosyltransferase